MNRKIISGKWIVNRLASELGFRANQRLELADKLGIDSYRLSIWKQRDNVPERALVALSILLNQGIQSLLGMEDFVRPVDITNRFETIDNQLVESVETILDSIAKAYGFDNKLHVKFIQKMNKKYGHTYYSTLRRKTFPALFVIDAHLETGYTLEQIVSNSTHLNGDDYIKSINCTSFENYLITHYDSSTSKAAKVNKVQVASVRRWMESDYIVINHELYKLVRCLNSSDNVEKGLIDTSLINEAYSLQEYIDHKLGGRKTDLARLAHVSRQAIDSWEISKKLIVADNLFSYKRALEPKEVCK
jgi:hypothetical protein